MPLLIKGSKVITVSTVQLMLHLLDIFYSSRQGPARPTLWGRQAE